jgi:hypothetical protein
VSALEFKICEAVIESLSVQLIDIGVAPFVIGVTIATFLLCRVRSAPMEPFAGLAVRRNLLMACRTQIRLRMLRKRRMALKAVLF